MLALVTLNAVLELSPLNSTSVPPDKTGFEPIDASPTLVPLEIFETLAPPEPPEVQSLQAVIVKLQEFVLESV